ncbi:MAG: IclR family transcriptional regulator [Ktedonobacteraceae bacterium]|nr:IclR family transcriptional regulator [Ktedonobacteraceae bacterium]
MVWQSKQNENREEDSARTIAPAPMVERAFQVLELLSASEEGLTLSELARTLNVSKGSIHGLLKTLEQSEVIEQEGERHFVLGSRIYHLAQAYIQRSGLRQFALPAMHRLALNTGETVCLGKVEQKGVRIIEYVVDEEKQAALHISARRGMRVPLLAAATASCLLASWPVAQREEFLRSHPLPRFTENSLTDPEKFLKRVEETARTGVGFDHEEYLDGVNAVAVPIYGFGGTQVALLWVFGFASRWSGEALEHAAMDLRAEAVAISTALGDNSIDSRKTTNT